MKIKEIAMKR